MRCAWTQLAQVTIMCGLLALYVAANGVEAHPWLVWGYWVALAVIAFVFVATLAWGTYVVTRRRQVKAMSERGYKWLDTFDLCLFLYWILCWVFPACASLWLLPVIAMVWVASATIAWRG